VKLVKQGDYADTCGEWTITRYSIKGVQSFLLFRNEEIIGKFADKELAKKIALELSKNYKTT
jgi:hypothetical protein